MKIDKVTIRQYNPITIAYIGDCVFELYIRERLLKDNINLKTNELHKMAVDYVKASSQSSIMEYIENELTEEELYFYKRGRNAKSQHVPRNAVVVDYKRATGFETLIGYLHLTGQEERLNDILELSAKMIEENKSKEL